MDARRNNARTVLFLMTIVVGMVGLTFASVPLYRLFCQVTGFGGTTQVAESMPEESGAAGGRLFTVRFNADVDPRLPWAFQPLERSLRVKAGESALAVYRAQNIGDRPITGTATFNVTPLKAGRYFSKVQCFCFEEQRLAAGETVDMAVSFFIDPAIDDDPNLDEVEAITLSYTFFRDLDERQEATGPVSQAGRGEKSGPRVGLN